MVLLTDELVEKLAIAYAQAYLTQTLQKGPEKAWDNSTIRSFLKCYDYASYQIPIEYEDFDQHF